MKACKCGSYAINHHCHGRDGTDGDLCDVCYWRKRAELKNSNVAQIKRELVGVQQEPVLMFYEQEWQGETSRAYQWLIDPFSLPAGTKLYTSPQPVQRKPLTDEEVMKVWQPVAKKIFRIAGEGHSADMFGINNESMVLNLARAIEAAHGIKENT